MFVLIDHPRTFNIPAIFPAYNLKWLGQMQFVLWVLDKRTRYGAQTYENIRARFSFKIPNYLYDVYTDTTRRSHA